MERGEAVVGTPDDVVAQIRRLEEKVPNFGCLLLLDRNWASTEHKKRSLELLMRYVLPEINGDNVNRVKSFDWARENRDYFIDVVMSSNRKAFEKHAAEEAAEKAAE
jgi:limonene 1,2-monooxygenase